MTKYSAFTVLQKLLFGNASDQRLLREAQKHAVDSKSAEEVICDAICSLSAGWWSRREVDRRLAPWVQRAAEDGQLWAVRWLGLNGYGLASRQVREQYLAQLAATGDTRAVFRVLKEHPDDPRLPPWLRRVAREAKFQDERQAAMLVLARMLDEAGDQEAGNWYDAACQYPGWESGETGTSWIAAVVERALRRHAAGDEEFCRQQAEMLLQEAAAAGPAAGPAPWADTSCDAEGNNRWAMEQARQTLLGHLLLEHELDPGQKNEVACLLSRRRIGVSSRRAAALACGTNGPRPEPGIAWQRAAWLYGDATLLAMHFAGKKNWAAEHERGLPADLREASIPRADFLDWYRRPEELPWFLAIMDETPVPDCRHLVITALEAAGLGERRSLLERSQEPYSADGLGEEELWRVLRGSLAWRQLFLAAHSEGGADHWLGWWDGAGTNLARVICVAAHQPAVLALELEEAESLFRRFGMALAQSWQEEPQR